VDGQACERRPWPIGVSNNRHHLLLCPAARGTGSPGRQCTSTYREWLLTRFLRSKPIPDSAWKAWKLLGAIGQLDSFHSIHASLLLPKSHMSDTQRSLFNVNNTDILDYMYSLQYTLK
jgi:hypothetical protein